MDIISFLHLSKYPALFIGTIFEGPVVMTASGFLMKIGALDFWPAYFLLLAGDLCADALWYALGYFSAGQRLAKVGKVLYLDTEFTEKVKEAFRQHETKIVFINKLTMGFGFSLAVLVIAGMSRVPFRKYMLLNFFGGLFWTAFLIGVGYLFGNAFYLVSEGLRIGFLIFVITFIVLALYGFSKFMRKNYKKII